MGDRLYDEFIVGLKQAIPNASDRRKTIHSLRKTFGDSLKQRGVSAEVRADILGHGGETVTEEVYCDPIALSTMLGIIMRLPNVTGHLERRLTTLLPWIEQKAPAPFSRRRRQSD